MMIPRLLTRSLMTVAATAVAMGTLSACGDANRDDVTAAERIGTGIQAAPDVIRVDSHYTTGVGDQAVLSYRVVVRPGTSGDRRKALADTVEKEVWSSSIAPINSFGVQVTSDTWNGTGIQRTDPDELVRSYPFPDTVRAALDKYGPRAVDSTR